MRADLAAPVLLDLPGVVARATDPSDAGSRARALDGLLRWQLARLEHELADSARVLFGAIGPAGTTLTDRRRRAAGAAEYEVHHFRKRIEPRLCAVLAQALAGDTETFAAVHAAAPALTAPAGPTRLAEDVFAWEAAEHDGLLSLLWSAVYELRAELLDVARMISMRVGSRELDEGVDKALWAFGRAVARADAYQGAYGGTLLNADMRIAPRELARLAGWIPPLDDDALDRIVAAYRAHPAPAGFLNALPTALKDTWHRDLTRPQAGDPQARPAGPATAPTGRNRP
ncbi:hypothetical protein [Kitasatospora sp. NPDC094015]|uniref:hypothetical protein n=1 Tax=Kitasatospora sp. NPDC094015 TaxID=3155205 RepID=UPI0033348885